MLRLGPQSQQAVDTLREQGIEMWPEQTDQPVLPAEISSLDSTQLSDLFTRVTAWSSYVSGQLSAAQIDEASIEKLLTRKVNNLMDEKSRTPVKGDRVTMVKAQVSQAPAVIKLEDELAVAYAYRKMVETIYYNLERDSNLISREITRRSGNNGTRRDRLTT